ncbi:glyoxalase/bleomycin resistance/extradiol dioxygenase family protein [Paenibacillus sp. IB182496]|uniref:Glyoxalase/bleomycin resistance/extradiol dioxygenase family protein n=1 Tax=Paenibacillus sabuli TaxID=2772509 RepID=A0A927GQG9_9BACL|nr:VOC family protein [Paenibacillus sabuli]MBD2843752.1 glyoxalase/bleomycin resistance/extradiol dioxygenase family protein [Paenibacillus sabuli]
MALTSSQIFVNLHVNDLEKSKAFFTELGFAFNLQFTDEKAACLVVGENIFVMLLVEEFFKSFTKKEIVDTSKYAQLTVAISAESRAKVDEIVNQAVAAGATVYADAVDHGFMYQWGFQDLDGHIWEIAYMDMGAFEEQPDGQA